MNEEQLQAIEERTNEATPGPWMEEAESGEWWVASLSDETAVLYVIPDTALMNQADVDFIAHASEDVPALIAEIRSLRTKLATVQVYARGIYGEVPPLSFDDWYDLVSGTVQP